MTSRSIRTYRCTVIQSRQRLWPGRTVFWARLVLLSLFVSQAANASAGYRVGIARVDVTPDYPVRLNGFGFRRAESEGVLQPIWAKAIAVQWDGDEPAVLVTLDNLGIRWPMVEQVALRVHESHGLSPGRLTVAFSHTHCAPKVDGACDNIFSSEIPAAHQEHIDRYTRELTDHLIQVVREALDDRQPAELLHGIGKVTFARNRRTSGGPVDHDLPILVIRSPEGSTRAVYCSYACHCVTLSHNLISGDWAGFAQEAIERRMPGTMALVSIGAGSDSNPESGVTGDKVDVARGQGIQIASEVERLLGTRLRPVTGPVTTVLERTKLPLKHVPPRNELEQLAQQPGIVGYNARTQIAKLDQGQQLPDAVPYLIQSWSFGDSLAIVFLAGEVCVDYSLRLKRELDRERVWINAYSNDFCCYIPSERLAQEGGYGGGTAMPYFCWPSTLKPGLEDQIVNLVTGQLPESFRVSRGTAGIPPRSPAASLAEFQLPDDLRIELVASEPLVRDPVAIDFGFDGSLWVVEMPDYARGVHDDFKPAGRVRRLFDDNGDGYSDRAETLLDDLRFPTGVTAWQDGVLVCDAPDILFARDTDGDGRADERRVLLSGFATHNPHARVNSLSLGLDGWVYGSGGLFGGEITTFSGEKVSIPRTDFRFRPETGEVEAVAGVSQQGRVRDDWDNWFGCANGTLAWHFPIRDEFSRRNPWLKVPATSVVLGDPRSGQQLFPVSDLVLFKLSGVPGRPTSACGIGVYRDRWLGAAHADSILTCEPVNQLVHRLQLDGTGPVFSGQRFDQERDREFLASSDRWFRPVQVRTGPDGGLWIVDMYRYVIEHPQWIPPETAAELDVFAGQDRGRIYRILPRSGRRRPVPDLTAMSAAELAAALDSGNGTVRDQIQHLLTWRIDPESSRELARLVRKSDYPEVRAQALWLLHHRKELQNSELEFALQDSDPRVVMQALRITAALADPAGVESTVLAIKASDSRVAYQLAMTLGVFSSDRASQRIAELLEASSEDPWLRHATLSSVNPTNLAAVFERLSRREARTAELGELAYLAVRMQARDVQRRILERLLTEPEETPGHRSILLRLFDAEPAVDVLAEFDDRLEVRRRYWQQQLRDSMCSESLRIEALRLMVGACTGKRRREELLAILDPSLPAGLQQVAMDSLAEGGDLDDAERLLKLWPTLTPQLRDQLLDHCLARTAWSMRLLHEMEVGRIDSFVLGVRARQALINHADDETRQAAQRILLTTRPSHRSDVVAQFRETLTDSGDARRGAELFKKTCSACHRIGEQGEALGPDLAALTTRSPESLLVSILDPNRDVDQRYLAYVAALKDGRTVTGMLKSETSTTLTLVEPKREPRVLLRADLEELRSSGRSFMPEGLEKEFSPEAFNDLIAYVRSIGRPPRQFPGNTPQTVRPDVQGEILLEARTAAIYGNQIRYEQPLSNIGYWHEAANRVEWLVENVRPGRYRVELRYSCADASAGNRFRIDAGSSLVDGEVSGTGGWDRYRWLDAGILVLATESTTIGVQSAGPIRQALFDLNAVRLTPITSK